MERFQNYTKKMPSFNSFKYEFISIIIFNATANQQTQMSFPNFVISLP